MKSEISIDGHIKVGAAKHDADVSRDLLKRVFFYTRVYEKAVDQHPDNADGQGVRTRSGAAVTALMSQMLNWDPTRDVKPSVVSLVESPDELCQNIANDTNAYLFGSGICHFPMDQAVARRQTMGGTLCVTIRKDVLDEYKI